MASTSIQTDDRLTKPAIWRGLQCKCPNCGGGDMFARFLKVADTCPSCGEVLSHHRADDGPAYLTILIVAHIIGLGFHLVWSWFRPDPLIMATGFAIAAVALSLWLLPRMKGMIVAIQWSRRMHGFGGDE